MSSCGIIAEYNPFHDGHAYQLAKARELSGADHVIVVMSGFFVQRGEPAIEPLSCRVRKALQNGADAVFLLPVGISTSSAEQFAEGGIRILQELGCGFVSFGIENTDPESLEKIAAAGTDEARLRYLLRNGVSYPAAISEISGTEQLLPNNILAVEYLKAIRKYGFGIRPVPVPRIGHGYSDTDPAGQYPSAAALRKKMTAEGTENTVFPDDALELLRPVLSRLIYEGRDLTEFLDVSTEIAGRLKRTDLNVRTFEELVTSVKTKQYTYTRIARCLMHILLDIREVPSHRALLLGFRRDAAEVLSEIRTPVISKAADAADELKQELFAEYLYHQMFFNHNGKNGGNGYGIITV